MDIILNIFGTLLLLLMAVWCRSYVVIEAKPKHYPKWVCWFGNVLAVASLISAVVIWFV